MLLKPLLPPNMQGALVVASQVREEMLMQALVTRVSSEGAEYGALTEMFRGMMAHCDAVERGLQEEMDLRTERVKMEAQAHTENLKRTVESVQTAHAGEVQQLRQINAVDRAAMECAKSELALQKQCNQEQQTEISQLQSGIAALRAQVQAPRKSGGGKKCVIM